MKEVVSTENGREIHTLYNWELRIAIIGFSEKGYEVVKYFQ